jgi:hypothetical protein
MLLTDEQSKHLSNGVNDYSFVFNDNDTVTDAERQWLKEMDDFWFEREGYHFIDNYQDLYKSASIILRKAIAV